MNVNSNMWAQKNLRYFEQNSLTRVQFKRACKRRDLKFEDFEEIHVDYYYPPNGRKQKKYTYRLKK